MTRQRRKHNTPVYVTLSVLNCCLVFMFAVILTPAPEPVVVASSFVSKPRLQTTSKEKPVLRLAKQGIPTHIIVPSEHINIGVKTGSYAKDSRSWTIDSHSAYYANVTVPANNSNGTTLIYGHGINEVFGRIPDITAGAQAIVSTDTGLTFTYEFISSRQVLPTDTSVLTQNGEPTLVLQTCSGIFDTYRTLVSFRLVGVTGYE